MGKARVIIKVTGLVQGIGYRPFVYRVAAKHGVKGYVLNLGDAGVKIVAEGDERSIKEFIKALKEEKPALAVYSSFDVKFEPYRGEFSEFKIERSSHEAAGGLSYPTPDLATCPKCVEEILNPGTRFYMYPFTSCTDCGPRFTVIVDLPYDRERTTMVEFPFCPECEREYNDPLDRRFNAQTTCCPKCGPKYFLYDANGELVDGDPVKLAAKAIDEGLTVAIKGIGGFHLAVDAYNEEAVARLRARRRKPQKPFAVMSRSISEVKKYAVVSKLEEELLRSRAAPIVILDKREPFPLADSVSPGLHNVGVMLPYAGVHYVLFEHMKAGTVVMTSANEPDEPMIIDNDRALRELGKFCDYVLLHNREIHMRCDDSVIRVVDGVPVPIRRSRGYTPEPVPVPFPFGVSGAAVGGEFMVTAGVAKMGRAFLSQHIGEVESPESVEFLGEALRHLLKILRVGDLDFVAVDMHPMFRSRRVAREVAGEFGAEVVEVQHHHAHMAALMVESGVADEEIVAIACDGVGYGTDGLPWGGEVLLGGYGGFKRVGNLEPQPMPGGDACAVWYGRMAEGVLFSVEEPRELTKFLAERCVAGFKRGAREVKVVLQQLEKNVNTVLTTSAGRLLDAMSCVLGVCFRRTYEGEGAMKLESAAVGGNGGIKLPFRVESRGGREVLLTSEAFKEAKDLYLKGAPRRDVAASFQRGLAEGLADIAVRAAQEAGVRHVGFTGGVAYNEAIVRAVKRRVEAAGLRFLRHRVVPCGDGGLALGQLAVAAFSRERSSVRC